MAKPLVDDLDRHIGQRLKKLRQKENLSAQALAEAVDSTQQQISRYENGQNKLSATQLHRIAIALGVPMAWFFLEYEHDEPVNAIAEKPTSYENAVIKEELAIVTRLWKRLSAEQRAALLKLMDSFFS